MKQNLKLRLNAANFLPPQTTTPDASSRSDRDRFAQSARHSERSRTVDTGWHKYF